jgi:hypothetical protein
MELPNKAATIARCDRTNSITSPLKLRHKTERLATLGQLPLQQNSRKGLNKLYV